MIWEGGGIVTLFCLTLTLLLLQVCGQSDWHTLPDSDVAMFTGAEVEDDEKFAQRIYDQQVAYSMQVNIYMYALIWLCGIQVITSNTNTNKIYPQISRISL